jgi:hypothetical protein
MDPALVIVGLIAMAIIFASLTPHPRTRRRKQIKSITHPPPLPPDAKGQHVAKDALPERELTGAEQASTSEQEAIQDRLAKARDLVNKSGVDSAACDILGMIHHWPSLLVADNGRAPLPVGPLNEGRSPAQSRGGREGKWFGWSLKSVPYRLELSVSPSSAAFDDDLDTGDLRLWVENELVMHLNVLKRTEVEYDQWTPLGVSALRPGSWMLRLNELATCLRAVNEPCNDVAQKLGDPQ